MQLIRFGVVGLLATATHIAIAWTVVDFIGPGLAQLLGFSIAFWVSYFGHSRFTFEQKGNIAKFAATAMGGLAINYVLLFLALHAGINERISLMLAALITPVFVFIASKLWVFK